MVNTLVIITMFYVVILDQQHLNLEGTPVYIIGTIFQIFVIVCTFIFTSFLLRDLPVIQHESEKFSKGDFSNELSLNPKKDEIAQIHNHLIEVTNFITGSI